MRKRKVKGERRDKDFFCVSFIIIVWIWSGE